MTEPAVNPANKRARCYGCGAEILWVTSPLGKPLPLDAGSVVYELTDRIHEGRPVVRIRRHAWVSHFRTCPKASQFSGGKKSAQPTTEGQCPASTSQ